VIATQNPTEQVGTFPLPESQLDRFLMRLELGYPGRDAERALLSAADRRDLLAVLEPCITPASWLSCRPRLRASMSRPRFSTTCRPSSSTRGARRTTWPAFRPAPPSGWCTRRAPGPISRAGNKGDTGRYPGHAAGGGRPHRLRPAHDRQRRVDIGAQLLAGGAIP